MAVLRSGAVGAFIAATRGVAFKREDTFPAARRTASRAEHGAPPFPELAGPSRSKIFETAFRGSALLVADSRTVASSVHEVLADYGYAVTTVASDRKALQELRAGRRFDVIVKDLSAARRTRLGLERIRDRDPDLPVVLLAGSSALESAVEAVAHGVFGYLVKPISPKALVEMVNRAVRWHLATLGRREAGRLARPWSGREDGALSAEFGAALARLWMATQPIVSWSEKTVFAYEASVRTNEAALHYPRALFDVAARLDQLPLLGRAIRFRVAVLIRAFKPTCPLFVSIRPADLDDSDLLSERGVLTPFAGQIVLDITEHAGLERIANVSARLARLRGLGYRIALDDLGSGYAGLASLVQVEPDIVKLDMSLVRGIDQSPFMQKIFRTTATLCRELNVTMIAEGVETRAERDCAVAQGGDLLQGFLFARPCQGFSAPRY